MNAIAETRQQLTEVLSWLLFLAALLPGGFIGYKFRQNGLWIAGALLCASFLIPFPTQEIAMLSHRGFASFAVAAVVGYFVYRWRDREANAE